MTTGTLALLLAAWSISQAAGGPRAKAQTLRSGTAEGVRAAQEADRAIAWSRKRSDRRDALHEHEISPARTLPLDYAPQELGGGPYDFSPQTAQPVLVQVWSTWCSSCLDTLVELRAIERQWATLDVAVRLIAVDDSPGSVMAHLGEANASWPVAMDHAASVRDALGITATPTLLLYDGAGDLRWSGEGMIHADDPGLIRALSALAGQG